MHLIIDSILSKPISPEDILNFLCNIPSSIGMNIILAPHVYKTDSGLGGIVVIAESHISVVTIEECKMVYIDVFSCKDFDTEKAEMICCQMLPLGNYTTRLLERSLPTLANS